MNNVTELPPTASDLVERIRAERKARRMTQATLAEQIARISGYPCPQGLVSAWERGHAVPSDAHLRALEHVLSVAVPAKVGGSRKSQGDGADSSLCVHHCDDLEDAFEVLKAAELIGLGVKMRNGGAGSEIDAEWVLELYADTDFAG